MGSGCTKSDINPEMCVEDEGEWIKKTKQHCSIINNHNPNTQNKKYVLFNVDSMTNEMNTNLDQCDCGWDWNYQNCFSWLSCWCVFGELTEATWRKRGNIRSERQLLEGGNLFQFRSLHHQGTKSTGPLMSHRIVEFWDCV